VPDTFGADAISPGPALEPREKARAGDRARRAPAEGYATVRRYVVGEFIPAAAGDVAAPSAERIRR